MALITQWDQVSERFSELERFAPIRPIVVAMQQLVAALREDPRLSAVEPSVSLAALNLQLSDSKRYVTVVWDEDEPKGFNVSFVDPPLEYSETTKVDESKVVATVIEYLDRLKGQ